MPGAFLMQQMQWREALDDARDPAAVEAIAEQIGQAERERFERIARLLDIDGDAAAAAAEVRAAMFVQRLRQDIERRLDVLEAR